MSICTMSPVAYICIAPHIYIIHICFMYGPTLRDYTGLFRFISLIWWTIQQNKMKLYNRTVSNVGLVKGSLPLLLLFMFKLFRFKYVWLKSGISDFYLHCPLYPGLTPSGALSTTAYWKFLRTDLRQGSCYEWVGFFCNPINCDLTSCLNQFMSHADESFPPTHESLIRKNIHSAFFNHRNQAPCWELLTLFFSLCHKSASFVVPCSHGL